MISRADTRTVRCQSCGGLTIPPKQAATDIRVLALRELAKDIGGCHDDTWRFFRTLIEAEQPYRFVEQLAHDLCLSPSTLTSKFWRRNLPVAKRYLCYVMCMRVAAGRCSSTWDAAALLGFSSAQSVGRMIRQTFGVTATDFIANETGESVLERFRQDLILPYRDAWLDIRMLAQGPRLIRSVA